MNFCALDLYIFIYIYIIDRNMSMGSCLLLLLIVSGGIEEGRCRLLYNKYTELLHLWSWFIGFLKQKGCTYCVFSWGFQFNTNNRKIIISWGTVWSVWRNSQNEKVQSCGGCLQVLKKHFTIFLGKLVYTKTWWSSLLLHYMTL